ncbi:hypothetical protein HN827_02000, partial [archaeon]|nr:hypothetical protein [archaeon]
MEEQYLLFDLSKEFLKENKGKWTKKQWDDFLTKLKNKNININEKELKIILKKESKNKSISKKSEKEIKKLYIKKLAELNYKHKKMKKKESEINSKEKSIK